ncbi:MAG: AAA family ATPase [Parcubacteria group bacterium]|jgi:chromosome segregation protein
MFLKKVEISGFKSFAHKTVLEFASGNDTPDDGKRFPITAVVGPNGSGKSNVADAIRWAMGEQSMKNLRGKKSEDIIFAGSGKKERLGSAWASLHFDNHDKRIPLEFSEVVITRKLFRSGESEYLINGIKVRLLDVIDLLAKAGVGKESYCVINQGMSDATLNATPAERRMVLEDAAGVKHFQIKKERAIKKLDTTRENLGRVGDLLKEIEPHLKMLKRQAEKAQKGKDVADRLKEKQIKLYSFLWHSFQEEKNNVLGEKGDFGAKMMNVQREADKINDQISKYSKEVQGSDKQEEMEKKKQDLLAQLNKLEKELVITEGRIVIELEKSKAQKIIESIPVDLDYVKEKLSKIRKDQDELISRIQNAEKLEDLQDIKEFARAINQELFDLYEEVGKGEITPTSAEASAGKQKNTEAEEKIKALENDKIRVEKSIGEFKLEIEKINKEIENEREAGREARQKFFELEREFNRKQEELGKLKDQFNEYKIKQARIEVREEDLTNEIKNELKMDAMDLKFDGENVSRDELEKEIYRLKVQWEQIGGIDPLIVDEYEETKKRFEFLTNESIDLEGAMKSLREVIKEMDRKINEVFKEAFEKINEEFSKYFKIIFGGGQAKLIKSKVESRKSKVLEEDLSSEISQCDNDEIIIPQDKETTEELGVDISACPPGKRINNLSMLSGGERSLTSLALLFAIISYNPPPFAILDEVEAALDEANSKRFGRIIQELSDNTQFITITHNRETMRQASLLYGVTMGEDGISKLLSVRLDQVGQGGRIIK